MRTDQVSFDCFTAVFHTVLLDACALKFCRVIFIYFLQGGEGGGGMGGGMGGGGILINNKGIKILTLFALVWLV